MLLEEGAQVTPDVRLVRKLGQGGMGSVWLADNLSLKSQVAVKFMSAEMAQSPEAVARFEREASAAAQIRSPHVVQVYGHGVTDTGVPYMILELLDGEDLGQRIERLGPLALEDVALVVSQACKGLGRAHDKGIIHRDIKPDNIFLLDADGELFVKLLDFGIAKQKTETSAGVTTTGTMVGTPYYMSPEQMLNAKGVDARSDLWSLAVVVYHALTGSVPFDGESLGAICVAIEKAQFVPPSRRRADLPPSLDAWFERALARGRDDRFPTARAFADELLVALGGAPPSSLARPSLGALPQRPQPPASISPAAVQGATAHGVAAPSSSSRTLVGVALAGLLVVGVGAAALLSTRRPEPAARPDDTPPARASAQPEPSAAVAPSTPSTPKAAPPQPPEPSAQPPSPVQSNAQSSSAKAPAAKAAKPPPPAATTPPPAATTPPPAAPRPPPPSGPKEVDRGF